MVWISGISLCFAVLVVLAVCTRFLLTGSRSGDIPELSMGLGGLLLAVLGGPMAGIARSPMLLGTPTGDRVFAVGLGIACLGVALIHVFPWRVFHPRSFWALGLVLLASASLGATWQGLISVSEGGSMQEIFQHTRPYAMGIVTQLGVAFAWTGVESCLLWRRLKRQLALGLADPVVVNRVELWAAAGLATAALNGGLLWAMAHGRPPMTDPICLVVMSVSGLAAAGGFALATFPPKAYLARVRAHATKRAVAAAD